MLRTLLSYITPIIPLEDDKKTENQTPEDFNKVKTDLLARVIDSDPDVFDDNFQFDILKDPVIVEENGHVYERAEIEFWIKQNHSSPMTRKPRNLDDLKEAPDLKNIIHTFIKDKENILSKISGANTIDELNAIENDVKRYFKNIEKYVEQFKAISAAYQIRYLKNKDFLDIRNLSHLAHWHKPEPSRFDCDIVEVSVGSQKFNLQKRDHQLLMAADKKYKNVEAFRNALADVRKGYRNCWFGFYCMVRRKHVVAPLPESKYVSSH